MKKRLFLIISLVLLTIAVSGFAFAQNGTGFVDADQDGVCDLQGTGECDGSGLALQAGRNALMRRNAYQSGTTDDFVPGAQLRQNQYASGLGYGYQFGDLDGDGVCDNFIDEDGDGVCDHAGTGMGAMNGTGQGFGRGNGQGMGACDEFVDADGDGVCDNAGMGLGLGAGGNGQNQGQGAGRRGFQSQQNSGMGNGR
ncbi:MAG: hypothetical protein M9930_04315 [Anaerolineae bacterium]|nr:hypothetical protein [Anaerolineae bacterium]